MRFVVLTSTLVRSANFPESDVVAFGEGVEGLEEFGLGVPNEFLYAFLSCDEVLAEYLEVRFGGGVSLSGTLFECIAWKA